MPARAVLLALVLTMPVVVAKETAPAEHPTLALGLAWLDEANATRADAETRFARLDATDVTNAWRAIDEAALHSDVVDVAVAYGFFRGTVGFVEASTEASVGVDRATDGDRGCGDANSSCARLLAAADARRDLHATRLAEARAEADATWARLERARGLEAAVVAERLVLAAEGTSAGYADARERLLALPSYDPDSVAYRRILQQAWGTADSPLHLLDLADELREAAVAADATGPALDREAMRARRAAVGAALANATAFGPESGGLLADARAAAQEGSFPRLAALVSRYRAAEETDRLTFAVGDDADTRDRLAGIVDRRGRDAADAFTTSRALGYEGLAFAGPLTRAQADLADPRTSEDALAADAGELLAATDLHSVMLDPVVARAEDARSTRLPLAVVGAAAAAGGLALVAATALLLRRKA